jgi:hypothetical protein
MTEAASFAIVTRDRAQHGWDQCADLVAAREADLLELREKLVRIETLNHAQPGGDEPVALSAEREAELIGLRAKLARIEHWVADTRCRCECTCALHEHTDECEPCTRCRAALALEGEGTHGT